MFKPIHPFSNLKLKQRSLLLEIASLYTISCQKLRLSMLYALANMKPNIPHQYRQHKRSGFLVGSCDTAAADGVAAMCMR